MSPFVLVHGGMHGAWCWYKVVPELERLGHSVVAVDLPGHGADRTPLEQLTLQSCVERVTSALDSLPEPVILVGHSLGGVVISQAAQERPERIRELVYLSALMPEDGESSSELMKRDTGSAIAAAKASGPTAYKRVSREDLINAFFHDCPREDIVLAQSLLVSATTAWSAAPVHLSDDRYGSVARCYISCLRDRVVTAPMQAFLYGRTICRLTLNIDTGHSPFFAAPVELAALLHRCSGSSSR